MGRTKRRRKIRRPMENISLEHEDKVIALKRWMSQLNWQNRSKLILKNFRETGRGVSSLSDIKVNERIIEIPQQLLITLVTTAEAGIIDILKETKRKFKMQDILAVFLVIERHKNEKSKWSNYINTLPDELPHLPWLCDETELLLFPSDFLKQVRKKRWDFETSWERVEKSINSKCVCLCCEERLDRVITLNAFTWGYVMVNTRAVYVRPDFVVPFFPQDLSRFLSDEPCLALCPFLDMFNHSPSANTKAELLFESGSWNYTLTTLISYKKHEQIFISYGAHDNDKLFCEYGFFTPHNFLDTIQFSLEEIICSDKINLNKKQYSFVKNRSFDNELYVSIQGLSFKLKALIYVIRRADEENNWNQIIFSETYLESDLLLMRSMVRDLLKLKQKKYSDEVTHMEQKYSNRFLIILANYYKYKMKFTRDILDVLSNK